MRKTMPQLVPKTTNGVWAWTPLRASFYRPLAARIDALVSTSTLTNPKVLMGGMKSGFIPQLLPHINFDVVEANKAHQAVFDNVTLFHQDWYDVVDWPKGPHAVIIEDLGHSLVALTDLARRSGIVAAEIIQRLDEGAVMIAIAHLENKRFAHIEWRIP